jgi:hypothetical protein
MYEHSVKHFVDTNHEYLRDHYLLDEDWDSIKLLASWLGIFFGNLSNVNNHHDHSYDLAT